MATLIEGFETLLGTDWVRIKVTARDWVRIIMNCATTDWVRIKVTAQDWVRITLGSYHSGMIGFAS